MSQETTFDLEAAIVEWRKPYEAQRRYRDSDIEELERHLRDEIEVLMSEGTPAREAFTAAASEVGEAWAGEVEYGKAYWESHIRRPANIAGEIRYGMTLFANNVRVAFRNLTRHRAYCITNLAGLSIAIAGCLLVMLYTSLEFSRASYYPKADRIYRVLSWTLDDGGDRRYNRGSDGRIGPALLETFPEVEQVLRSMTEWPMRIRRGETVLRNQSVSVVDPTAIDMLDLPFVAGNRDSALNTPAGAILKESVARALFGDEDPIGQTVTLSDHWGGDYTVTGVIPDPPWTVFALNFGLMTTRRTHGSERWDRVSMGSSLRPIQTFILLRDGADLSRLSARLDEMNAHLNGDEWAGRSGYAIQPLTEIHLYSLRDYPGVLAFGHIHTVVTLLGIASFVLLVACINFINLTTARFAQRTREVGIRKSVGAFRRQLVVQFLSESVLLTVVAGCLAIVIASIALPTFAAYLEREAHLTLWLDGRIWLWFAVLTLFVGLFAGLYPAVVSSRLQPSRAISGRHALSSGLEARRLLVSLQFVISVVLITSTIVVRDQVDHLLHHDIGMNSANIIWIPVLGDDRNQDRRATVARAFRDHPNVLATAYTGRVPVFNYEEKVRGEGHTERVSMFALEGDEDFLDVLGIEVLTGRGFSRAHPTDATESVILNETAVRSLGWEIDSPDPAKNPIGKILRQYRFARGAEAETGRPTQVIGVVRLNTGHLSAEPAPIFIRIRNSGMGNILVRMRAEGMAETMRFLQETQQTHKPGSTYVYRLLDEAIDHVYRTERQVRDVASVFFILAIVISCFGLFALAALAVEQRTKELGIRKAVGASAPELFSLLTRGFLMPVAVACLVGWPIAYYLVNGWLSEYAHRIPLTPIPFATGGAVAIIAAFITVSYRSLNASRVNPVDALRYE